MKTSNDFMKEAKKVVFDYNVLKYGQNAIKYEDVYIVWFCKTLDNWKVMAATTLPDNMYYELTYDGKRDRIYLDAYDRVQHLVITKDTPYDGE